MKSCNEVEIINVSRFYSGLELMSVLGNISASMKVMLFAVQLILDHGLAMETMSHQRLLNLLKYLTD